MTRFLNPDPDGGALLFDAPARGTPALLALPDGRLVSAWQDIGAPLPGRDAGEIRARFVAPDGTPEGPGFTLNATLAGDQTRPLLAPASDGGFLALWQSGSSLWLRAFDADGTPRGAERELTASAAPLQAALAAQGDLAVMAWRDSSDDKIHLLRLDAGDGTPLGPSFRTNDAASGMQGGPMLAMLDSGGFVLGWTGGGLRIRVFDAEGDPAGEERLVGSFNQGARLAALPEGGFMILTAAHPGFHTGDLYLRLYDATGRPLGSTLLFDNTEEENSIPFAGAVSDRGEIAVVMHPGLGPVLTRMVSPDGRTPGPVVRILDGVYEDDRPSAITAAFAGDRLITVVDGRVIRFDLETEADQPSAPVVTAFITADGDDIVNIEEMQEDSRATLQGTADPGALVQIASRYPPENDGLGGEITEVLTTRADTQGRWEAEIIGSFGHLFLWVTAPSGQDSPATRYDIRQDGIEPEAPLFGPVAGDDIITAAEAADGIAIRGTAQPDMRIEVTIGDSGVTRETRSDETGAWSVTFEPGSLPADGQYRLSAEAVSFGGNRSGVGPENPFAGAAGARSISIALDPLTPVLTSPRIWNADSAAGGVTFAGTGTAGAMVEVGYAGRPLRDVQVGADGRWQTTFAPTDLPPDGTQTLSLRAIAADGSPGARLFLPILLDRVAPAAPTLLPLVAGPMITAADLAEGLVLQGTAPRDVTVAVFIGTAFIETRADARGQWSVPVDPDWLTPGTLRILAQTIDLAGNASAFVGQEVTLGLIGTPGADVLRATGDTGLRIDALDGDDRVFGTEGDDTIDGGRGHDTLNGGGGDDLIFGGQTPDDLADLIFGGAGNDTLYGGHGNDRLNGGEGHDLLDGGAGSDTLIGNEGNDTLNGGALSDLLFGGPGSDFLNGGFGFDRLNGGAGADTFFHLGVADHGSDWIQDYNAAEGDVLQFGRAGATPDQFQVNFANTPNAGGADVAEAFVIYRQTEQILWALVDGAAQESINIRLGGQVFDLLG